MPPGYTVFQGSICSVISAQGWSLTCRRPPTEDEPDPPSTIRGNCRWDELCMDRPGPSGRNMAWCMSVTSGGELLKAAASSAKRRVKIWVNKLRTKGSGLELVLTAPAGSDLFKAKAIAIAPVDKDNITLAKPASCQQCSRLTFTDPPADLAGYDVNITTPNAADEPLMHAGEV